MEHNPIMTQCTHAWRRPLIVDNLNIPEKPGADVVFVSIIRRLTSPYRRSGNLLRKQESHRQRDKNPHQKKKLRRDLSENFRKRSRQKKRPSGPFRCHYIASIFHLKLQFLLLESPGCIKCCPYYHHHSSLYTVPIMSISSLLTIINHYPHW